MKAEPTSLNQRYLASAPHAEVADQLRAASRQAASVSRLTLADLLAEAARRLETLAEGSP